MGVSMTRCGRTGALLVTVFAVVATSIVPFDVPGVPAARAATCDRTWVGGAGQFNASAFDVAGNWLEKSAPDKSAAVCFNDDVTFFSLVRTLGSIEVKEGVALRLNAGSVELSAPSSIAGVFLHNGATLTAQQDLTLPAGREGGFGDGESGTFAADPGFTPTLTVDGTFTRRNFNMGSLDIDVVNKGEIVSNGIVAIGATRRLDNLGVMTLGPTASVTGAETGRLVNRGSGRIDFTGGGSGPDAAGMRGVLFDNGGTVRVLSGDVSLVVNGGTSTGTWEVGVAGQAVCATRLYLRARPTMTFTGGSVAGPGCVNVFEGTTDVGASSAWSPARIEIFGATLQIAGTRTLPELRYGNGGRLNVNDGTATTGGAIGQTSSTQMGHFGGNGTLVVDDPWTHVGGNGLQIQDSLDIVVESTASFEAGMTILGTATFTNRGSWTLVGPSVVAPDATAGWRNEGMLTVEAGATSVMFGGAKGLDNVGTVRLSSGTLDMRTPFVQLVGGRLTAGRVEAAHGTLWQFFPATSSIAGEMRVEGDAFITTGHTRSGHVLGNVTRIEPTGALEVHATVDQVPSFGSDRIGAGLLNEGRLSLSDNAFFNAVEYTQTATAELEHVVTDTGVTTFVTFGTTTLAGRLRITPARAGLPLLFVQAVMYNADLVGAFDEIVATDGGTVTVDHQSGSFGVQYLPKDTSTLPPIVLTPTASVVEGTGGTSSPQILVSVENPNPFSIPMSWTAAPLTATLGSPGPGVDVTVPAGATTLVPGPNSVFVPIVLQGDSLSEADETFTILWAPGAPATTVTIVDDDDPPPVLTFGEATFVEGSGGGTVTVTRNSSKAPLNVAVESLEGTADPGFDYEHISTTIQFATGQLQASVFVDLIDDDVDEPDETFTLSFANGAFTKTVTITDDDEPPPTGDPEFQVRVEAFGPYAEDVGTFSVNVRLDRTLAVPMTFRVYSLDGIAEAGEDYEAVDTQITIPAGQTEGPTVQVTIIDDDDAYEFDRELFAIIAARNGKDLAGDHVEIVNDDTGPQARFVRQSSDDASDPLVRALFEGNGSDPTLPLQIELLGDPITAPTTVTITAQSSEADGDDFSVSTQQLVFQPGDTTKTVTFTSFGDTELEQDELVLVGITTPFGDSIGRVDDQARITIVDDDQALTLTPSARSVIGEDEGVLTVSITADHAPGEFVTIPVSLSGTTTADAGPVQATATLAPDATSVTFDVPIVDDGTPELDETFTVQFGAPTQGKVVPPALDVTIVDDDPAEYTLAISDVTVTEGDFAFLEIVATPNGPGTGALTLPIVVSDITTNGATDWVAPAGALGSVTIPAGGGTVVASVLTMNDVRFEVPELFRVTVGRAAVAGEQVSADVTIEDDDPFPNITVQALSPVNEDVGTVSVIVRVDVAPGSPISLLVESRDGDAIAGEDYVGFSRTVTIAEGATHANTFFVQIIDDATVLELPREGFVISASHPAVENATEVVVEIVNDDEETVPRFVRQPDDPANEPLVRSLVEGDVADSTLPLQVELVGPPLTEPLTVQVDVRSVDADDTDYRVEPLELVFQPGETGPKTVTFTSEADSEVEADEEVVVTVSVPIDGDIAFADDEAQVTIVNDDISLTLTPTVVADVGEGASFGVTVTADHAPGKFVTIPVSVRLGTAGEDDVNLAGLPTLLTLGPDDTSAFFLVPTVDDDVPEPDETVVVEFGTPTQGVLAERTHTVSIVDDDPPAFTVSVDDVTVSETGVAQLTVTATPVDADAAAAFGPFTLPAVLSDVTTNGATDWEASDNTNGTISFPAGGGTVTAQVLPVNDDRFEVTEIVRLTVGRAFVLGEQDTADITIEDDDAFPNVTVQVGSPVNEDVGEISVIVRVDRAPGSAISLDVSSVDGFAEAGEDFVGVERSVTIAEGSTQAATFFVQILNDLNAFEFDRENFGIEVRRGADLLAFGEVEIIDDDTGPQARFVRQVTDPATAPLVRRLVEGDTTDTTLPLQVELLGDPITEPTTVTVNFDSFLADDSDYSIAPTVLTFQPGETGPKTVTFTARADLDIELDEVVIVALQTDFGDLLGRVDDEAQVTIANDDIPPPADPVQQFHDGWAALLDAIRTWLAQFDLTGPDAPAVATPDLAQHFDLPDLFDDLQLPTLDPAADTLPELCASLVALGFTLQGVAGGACGATEPSTPGDVINASFDVTLEDLLKGLGFGGDPYHDGTQGVLQSLAAALGLDGEGGGWLADLRLDLQVGVDADGFFLDDGTTFALDVGGSLDIGGDGDLGGASTPFSGIATSDFTVDLLPSVPRLRDLSALLDPRIDGLANLSLDFDVGPLDLTWSGEWTMTAVGVTIGTQTLTGTLTLPGLETGDAPALIDVVGTFLDGVWTITADATAGLQHVLGGFDVDALTFVIELDSDSFAGNGSLDLSAPLPGGPSTVAVDVALSRASVSFDGRLEMAELGVGSPELLRLILPYIEVSFAAALNGGTLTGGIEVGAAEAIVLPADPVGTATGVVGALTSDGALTLSAATMSAEIANGALLVDLTDVDFALGDGTGPNLLTVGSATGRFPALDDLAVTLTGLFLTKAGVYGASSVDVASQGFAESIGLGGILPFDVTAVTVVFPAPSNLDSFEVSVVGRFDFEAFPQIAGFVPRVGLGGPVVTPQSPDEENRFTFSVDVESLSDGIVRPLDIGPITLGFDGLQAGDTTIGADITLGGFVDGEFQSEIGGSLRVDGAAGSILDDVEVTLNGTLTPGTTTVADISGNVVVSGTFGPLTITDLDLRAGVVASLGPAGLTLDPRVDGLDVGSIELPLGDLMTLRIADAEIDFDPPAGGNVLEVGDEGGLTVAFEEGIPVLAGWGGTFRNFAVGDDLTPKLLPGFGFDLTIPEGQTFGLPDFIPLVIDAVGISFPNVVTAPPEGIELTPALLDGLRVRVSGGLVANATWPISAAVDGLEIDLGLLVAGQFPITNLNGFRMGVEPFELPGGVTIGGGLELGTIDVDGQTVFYGRVFGDFSVADIGGGADLVVTQYGPVLMKVRAPLGIPLGPSGIVLAGAEGAAQFGAVGIPVPPRGDPVALLNNFVLPTDLTITPDVIRNAVRPAVAAQQYTWQQGFALALAGDLIVAAAPGVIKGRATVGFNLGLPTGPSDPPGLQLVGKGEVTAFGIPLGQAGFLVDFAQPLQPSFDFAFASPLPGSPLALIFPARATFGVQLRTDGVVLGTIEGLRVFAQKLLDGTLAVGGDLFDAVLGEIAAQLDDARSRPLAQLLLDLDGDGSVSPAESSRTITSAFLLDRLLGRNELPALLPVNPSGAAFDRAARAATAFLNELLLIAGQLLDDPDRAGDFAVAATEAFAALTTVVRDATAAALQAFGARFDPSFTITGALQPTFFGLPLGSPVVGGTLNIDRSGLFFEMEGSLVELGQASVGAIIPVAAPAIDAILTAATLGLSDQISIGARLPFGGVVDALLGGTNLPTFQPLDPNWAITFEGSLNILGYEGAELSGIAFLPNQATFLDARVQKLYELPANTPIDPNKIPITTQAKYDALVEFGGILVTASLRVPRLITRPGEQLAALPPPPADPLAYLQWLEDLAATATQTDTPARVQLFLPGVLGVTSDATAQEWASNVSVEGVWEGSLLGLDLGRANLLLTPAGLEVTGQFPLLGLSATATINTALLSGGAELPSAGLDVNMTSAQLTGMLTRLGVPASFVPSGSGRFRAFTPGFDPSSTDPVRRNGGIEARAELDVPGLLSDAQFTMAVTPRAGGVDVRASATVAQIGPIAGVTIRDATVELNVVGGVATSKIRGSATVLGANATVDATLSSDLTGQMTITFTGGTMSLAGAQIAGSAVLTLSRVNGVHRGSLAILGVATLPAWLATASGQASLQVGACVDTSGNAEVALSMPQLLLGPNRLVVVGRNPNAAAALPPSTAGCALPASSPTQHATGPLFRLRVANGQATAVLNASLQFNAGGAAIAGMTVAGSLNSLNGTGSLTVSFAGGNLSLSGFTIAASATASVAPGSFSMSVNGTMSVPGLMSNAVVTGTATELGITHLGVSVGSFTMAPLTVSSFTLGLDRTAPLVYALSVGANVSFTGIGAMAVTGTLNSSGHGSLSVSATNLTVAGASITNGQFSVVREPGATRLSVAGRFSFFGASLEVVQASLTLSQLAPVISGSLVLRTPGGGTLTLGGFTIGGALRMSFAGTTSSISIDNGTVGINGWGSVAITASISVPVQSGAFFQLSLPSGGLRLGAADSPFFATGTFRLSFTNNVVTLSATGAGVAWRSGATTLASITGNLSVSSNGSVSASLSSFSATLTGGFAFTVPSLSLFIDAAGLNARLSLGAGSLVVPGFPSVSTPAFTIGTASTFTQVLVANELDLGVIAFHGRLVFERQSGVFRLRLDSSPSIELEGLVSVPLPNVTIASDGTFSVSASFPIIGLAGVVQVSGASLAVEKTGAALTTLAGRITGGRLLVGSADPIVLPTLDFGASTRFDETFTLSGWELGPFLRASSISVRLRQLSTGVIRFTVENDPSVTAFAGSTSMLITSFTAESDGTFTGTVTGRLALFGTRLAQATFNVSRDGDSFRLSLASPATIDLGFLSASMSGFARSTGSFAFSGSTSVGFGVTGFSFSGSLAVSISSADGIEGSYNGQVCFIACATTGGSLRSDGRIRGFLQIDLNNDGDFRDFGEVNADWRVYLATLGVRVDHNRDGDWEDFGDIVIGTATDADVTDPSMSTPLNITVIANIGTGGRVRVYYTPPTATDSGVSLTVTCSPAPGSEFAVGETTVTCRATDRANNTRTKTFTVTVIGDTAQAVPTADNGATVAVTAPGFMPFSTAFVRIQSDPVFLGVVPVDANGNVILDVLIPLGLPPGEHDIIIEGLGVRGGPWSYVQPFVIPAPVIDAPASVPVDPAGRPAPPASTPASPVPLPTPIPLPTTPPLPTLPGRLPDTGAESMPVVAIATTTLLIGLALVLATRRRRTRPFCVSTQNDSPFMR